MNRKGDSINSRGSGIRMLGNTLHRPARPARSYGTWLAWLAMGCFVGAASGQDELHVRLAEGGISKRSGQIVEWTGSQILLATGERQKRIDATTVVDVQTLWPGELIEARELMALGRYPEAAGKLELSREAEGREWVVSIISAEMLQCHDAAENPMAATLEFLRIHAVDPQTRFFYLIPLPWIHAAVNAPADAETEKWMSSSASVLKLLGASWRLSGAMRADAKRILDELSRDPDERIAQLAVAQLWRAELPTANADDVDRWIRQLNRFETKLRAGPYCVVGEAQLRLKQSDRAKISLMKIPVLYPEKKSLAACALFRTASILDDESRKEQAMVLKRELLDGYPDSSYADLVKQQ